MPRDYDELRDEIAGWAGRSDLTERIPLYVRAGEALLNRRLRLLSMEAQAPVEIPAGADRAPLPDRWIESISLRHTDQPGGDVLTQISPAALAARKSDTAGWLSQYAITGGVYELVRPADRTYDLTAHYYRRWDLAADGANSLLDDAPEVYLYAALVELASYTRNRDAGDIWAARRDEVIADLNSLDARSRRSAKATLDPTLAPRTLYDIAVG